MTTRVIPNPRVRLVKCIFIFDVSAEVTRYNTYNVRRNGTANSSVIAEQTPGISALFAFGTTTASQATFFGFKKERTEEVRGSYYTTANGAAPRWAPFITGDFR